MDGDRMIDINLEKWREDLGDGFYRIDGDGIFHHAPNFVRGPGYDLFREQRGEYSLPIEGWLWFDSEAAARQHYALPPIPEQTNDA